MLDQSMVCNKPDQGPDLVFLKSLMNSNSLPYTAKDGNAAAVLNAMHWGLRGRHKEDDSDDCTLLRDCCCITDEGRWKHGSQYSVLQMLW